jgi:MFS family permease
MKTSSNYRWFVVSIFFFFMLLHQSDKLLIGPLTTQIMETFDINMTQMGAVSTGALIVGAIFYPVWGFLNDRYSRAKLLALASFIWGSTTWLNAKAPTYTAFLVTRSSTGIDDSSYPGLYSLVSDYFAPRMRGKVYGILQLTGPLGYLIGMILGLVLSGLIGWRGVFFITGSLGVLLSIVIFFGVKEAPRGQAEPEMAGVEQVTSYRFDWKTAIGLFKKRSLVILFIQGFFGVFPWNAITYWFFNYLEVERGYTGNTVLVIMAVAVLVLAAGYPLGGALGDHFFGRDNRGRLFVAATGVISGAVLLWVTLSIPNNNTLLFGLMLALTAIFIPMAAPNVISTVYDVTLPEVRSTALSIQYFIESAGAALSPLLVGMIADQTSLKSAFLIICTSTWILCAIFFLVASRFLPKDIKVLRDEMQARANIERSAAG